MTRELRIPVRTVALWSPDKGLYFDLLLQGYFENGRSAQNQVDILPIGFSNAARVISGWDRRTHIFSDPYAGGVRKISSK